MYPKQHVVVSGLAALVAGLLSVPPIEAVLWALLGAVAGVVIDVDHAVLGMTIGGKWQTGWYWFRHPVKAVAQPDTFLAEMAYDTMIYHRLLSHVTVLGVLSLLLSWHVLVLPVIVGLAAHIAADVAWDARERNYWFLQS